MPRRIRALGEGVDLLGDGGYAIAPPSRIPCTKSPPHPPGPCNTAYWWERRGRIAPLPQWIIGRAIETPDRAPQAIDRTAGREMSYGQAALVGECARVAQALPGTRNETLNAAAWRLGRLVAGGELDPAAALASLWNAAHTCGLVDNDGVQQTRRTIDSGLQAGARHPRTRPPKGRARGADLAM